MNEAHLVALRLRATITLTYIPVMTPGLYDYYWMVSWAIFGRNMDILAKEMSQDVQETCQWAQETCLGVQETGT